MQHNFFLCIRGYLECTESYQREYYKSVATETETAAAITISSSSSSSSSIFDDAFSVTQTAQRPMKG
jgi:hypothetical protein